ncbi:uncharacterized protein DS421_20g694330 [Arachis hypogaea]|nr:uncharacterized protein DS421_20g694330 [Arachis hypogaea]
MGSGGHIIAPGSQRRGGHDNNSKQSSNGGRNPFYLPIPVSLSPVATKAVVQPSWRRRQLSNGGDSGVALPCARTCVPSFSRRAPASHPSRSQFWVRRGSKAIDGDSQISSDGGEDARQCLLLSSPGSRSSPSLMARFNLPLPQPGSAVSVAGWT